MHELYGCFTNLFRAIRSGREVAADSRSWEKEESMIHLSIEKYREQAREVNATLPRIYPEIPRRSFDERLVLDTEWGKTEIDVFYPSGNRAQNDPVLVNFHGGGYCIGYREQDDPFCRRIAESARCIVLNADYVTSPEHKFPDAIEQSYSLVKWLHSNSAKFGTDPDRIAIGGHSSGGGIAAAVCLLMRQRKEFPIATQILDYPFLDLATPPAKKDWRGISEKEKAEVINVFENYNAWYLPKPEQSRDPLVSPALATIEQVMGVPPALIIVAGQDALADEADRYARLLMLAGVEVRYRRFPESIHGFTHIEPAEPAREAWALMARHLRESFDESGDGLHRIS
jgi:acetyl esterase